MNKQLFVSILLINGSCYITAMKPKINQEIEESIHKLIAKPSQRKRRRRLRKVKSDILLLQKKDKHSNLARTLSIPVLSNQTRLKLLIDAIKNENPANVKKYARKDIINYSDFEERTPLIWAALFGNGTIIKMLLDQGADPNRTNRHGNTALHIALIQENPNPGIVQLLINAGTRLELKNNNKYSITRMLKTRQKKNPMLKQITID